VQNQKDVVVKSPKTKRKIWNGREFGKKVEGILAKKNRAKLKFPANGEEGAKVENWEW